MADVKYCTIAKDGTTSGAVDLEDSDVLGLILPALDNAALTFTVSATLAGTYVTLKSQDASTAFTITASTGSCAIESNDLDALKGYRFVKIVAGAAQTTAARTFTWILKKNWKR